MINMNEAAEYARKNPQHAKILLSLAQIDGFVKQVASDTIQNQVSEPDTYYIKTETDLKTYILSLYNTDAERSQSIAFDLYVFLKECQEKTVEFRIQTTVTRMIKNFNRRED